MRVVVARARSTHARAVASIDLAPGGRRRASRLVRATDGVAGLRAFEAPTRVAMEVPNTSRSITDATVQMSSDEKYLCAFCDTGTHDVVRRPDYT